MEYFADGIHDIDSDRYHASQGVSQSSLKLLRRNPARYRHLMLNGWSSPKTKALIDGTAIHTAVLEPEKFHLEYIVGPEVNKRTNAGKAEWQGFIESNPGKVICTQEDYDTYLNVAKRLHSDPQTRDLLMLGEAERSVYRTDPETGLQLKCRPDYWHPETLTVVDLKTTEDAECNAFSRSADNYGYALQQAFYERILQPSRFIFIAVEKTEPYDFGVYELHPAHVAEGHREVDQALMKLKACLDQDHWPSYTSGVTQLQLPYRLRARAQHPFVDER